MRVRFQKSCLFAWLEQAFATDSDEWVPESFATAEIASLTLRTAGLPIRAQHFFEASAWNLQYPEGEDDADAEGQQTSQQSMAQGLVHSMCFDFNQLSLVAALRHSVCMCTLTLCFIDAYRGPRTYVQYIQNMQACIHTDIRRHIDGQQTDSLSDCQIDRLIDGLDSWLGR